jgi:hypothetical protein
MASVYEQSRFCSREEHPDFLGEYSLCGCGNFIPVLLRLNLVVLSQRIEQAYPYDTWLYFYRNHSFRYDAPETMVTYIRIFRVERTNMLKYLRRGWTQVNRFRDRKIGEVPHLSIRDIKLSDIKRTIRGGGSLQGRMRVFLGWVLVGIGLIGIVMPVIPGAFLLVVGAALTGWRHPLVDKMAEPMFRLSDALPEEKIPRPLRPLWAGWRSLDRRPTQTQQSPNETSS